MPRYVIERVFDQGESPSPAASQRSIQLMDDDFSDLTWEHSHVIIDDENGFVRTFCIYGGPNPERIRQHAAQLTRHTVLNIYEIEADVAPADIPPPGDPVPERYVSTPDR